MWSLERVSDLHQKNEKENAFLAAQVHWRNFARKKGKKTRNPTPYTTPTRCKTGFWIRTHTHTPIATSRIVYSVL